MSATPPRTGPSHDARANGLTDEIAKYREKLRREEAASQEAAERDK